MLEIQSQEILQTRNVWRKGGDDIPPEQQPLVLADVSYPVLADVSNSQAVPVSLQLSFVAVNVEEDQLDDFEVAIIAGDCDGEGMVNLQYRLPEKYKYTQEYYGYSMH